MRSHPRYIVAVLLTALVAALLTVVPSTGSAGEARAASAVDFDPGYIVSDEQFYDGDAMTATEVQSFLDSKQRGCSAGYTCLNGYSQRTPDMAASAYCDSMTGRANESAASIIARVGAACDISQRFMLVLLEKEQSLVTLRNPSSVRYERATGFGCPDTAPCDSSVGGFFYQVYYGARQFNRYAAHPQNYNHRAGVVNQVRFHPNAACGTSPVLIRNVATAGLYNYTPYQPNSAALRNMYGTGDSCSAYGNRNTWRIWTDWFGDPTLGNASDAPPAFARDSSNGRIYLLGGGKKHYVPSTSILLQYSTLGDSVDRTPTSLAAIPSGPDLSRLVRDEDGRISLVDRSRLHHFASCAQMQAWRFDCGPVAQIDPVHVALLRDMGNLNSLVSTDAGTTWLIQSGSRRQVANPALLPAFGFSATPSEISASIIEPLQIGHPVVGQGDVVRSSDRLQARVVASGGAVFEVGQGQLGLRFVREATVFERESLRLMPATAGALPDRFSDADGSWVIADTGALRVSPAHYGGAQHFPKVDALRSSLPVAGQLAGPHFVRPSGSTSIYLVASGRATLTTPATFDWYSVTFGVPRTVWPVARDVIEPVPQPSNYADGTLIRSPAGAIYMMDGGNALHVTNMAFVANLGLSLQVQQVSTGIIAGLESRTGYLNSSVVRVDDRSYVALDGALHPFSSDAVRAAWGSTEVTLASAGALVPVSPQAATNLVNDRDGHVYLLEAGKRRPVNSVATLVAIGGVGVPRLTLPDSILSGMPEGTWVTPRFSPGTLVMEEGRAAVWVIDGDRRLHLGDFATSISLGLGYRSTTVPAGVLHGVTDAGALSSSLIACGDRGYVAAGGAVLPMSASVRAAYPAVFTQLSGALCQQLTVADGSMTQFIRADNGRVYYVEAGVRHWLGSAALARLGGARSIVEVDRSVIAAIPQGATWSS